MAVECDAFQLVLLLLYIYAKCDVTMFFVVAFSFLIFSVHSSFVSEQRSAIATHTNINCINCINMFHCAVCTVCRFIRQRNECKTVLNWRIFNENIIIIIITMMIIKRKQWKKRKEMKHINTSTINLNKCCFADAWNCVICSQAKASERDILFKKKPEETCETWQQTQSDRSHGNSN